MAATRRRRLRSITLPVVFASVAVALSIALLVGWTWLIAKNFDFSEDLAPDVSLLVLGIVSFVFIMGVLVAFSVFLAREVREARRQDTFLDSVTHELKSPLASLRLCLETLDRAGLDLEQRSDLRSMMGEDLDRLSSFIDDVLQVSRLYEARTRRNLDEVDLEDLVQRSVDRACAMHNLPAGAIRTQVANGLRVRSDSEALDLVLKNLIDNALKYSDAPPTVSVRASVRESRPILEVEDRGIGIPRQHLKKIFHRFFRVPEEEARQRHGTGIGLFVVWSLVRELGGRVQAHSDGPGQGTRVCVVLPANSVVTAAQP